MPVLTPPARRASAPASASPASSARSDSLQARGAWTLLGWIGLAFAILGFTDIALGWYPTAFGNAEWEFGTISGSLNALAIPMLGLYLALAAAIARGKRNAARGVGVAMVLTLVILLGLGMLYLLVTPVALKAVAGNPLADLGIRKAIIKALSLGVVDCVLLAAGIRKAWGFQPTP